jgi:Zn-dependent protease
VSGEALTVAGVPLRVRSGLVAYLAVLGVLRWHDVAGTTFVHAAAGPPVPAPDDPAAVADFTHWIGTAGAAEAATTHPGLLWVAVAIVGSLLVYVGSVLAHELGHLFAARRVGVDVTAVELHAFGGFVEHADDDRLTAGSLAAIAGAGPLVTAALALLAFGLLRALGWPLLGSPDVQTGAALAAGSLLTACFLINALALVVNLLPFRGLDGAKLSEAERLWRARR